MAFRYRIEATVVMKECTRPLPSQIICPGVLHSITHDSIAVNKIVFFMHCMRLLSLLINRLNPMKRYYHHLPTMSIGEYTFLDLSIYPAV